jgi:hypothetical protein
MGRRGRRLAVAVAGLAAAVAGSAGMGLVRAQAAGLDGGPILESTWCGGLCATTFTYDRTEWVASCTPLADDAVSDEALAVASGAVAEVRAIDGVDVDRSLAVTGAVCDGDGWWLAIPVDDWGLD